MEKAPDPRGKPLGLNREGFDAPFVFCIAAWAALSMLLFLFVVLFGQNMPYHDDLNFIDALTGPELPTWDWFWALHNQHRFPLVRLVLLAVARLFSYDMRPVFFLSATALSAGSLMLMLAIYRFRGRGSWLDAVIPLYGISLIHYWNLFEALNLGFCLYLFLFALVISGILRGFWKSMPGIVLVAAAIVMLSINGAYGLAASLVFIPGLVILGISVGREPGGRLRGAALLLSAVAALGSAVPYLSAILGNEHSDGSTSTAFEAIDNLPRAVAMAWGGTLPRMLAPGDTWASRAPLLAMLFFGLALAGWHVFERKADRRRAVGLFVAFLAVVAVGVAVAYGRSGMRWMGAWYATMFTPLPWLLYFLSAADRRPWIRLPTGSVLALLGVLAVIGGTHSAWRQGSLRRAATERLMHDARGGVAPQELASMHWTDKWSDFSGRAEIFELMHRRQLSVFDESSAFILEPSRFPEGHAWVLSRIDPSGWAPDSPDHGSVHLLKEHVVLRVISDNAFFPLQSDRNWLPESAGLMRITMLSPCDTVARFRAAPNLMTTVPVQQGSNVLTFRRPGAQSGITPRFSPGLVPGNYRIVSVWTYPFPVEPSAFPEPVASAADLKPSSGVD